MRIRNHTGKPQAYGGRVLPYTGWTSCDPGDALATEGYRLGHIDWEIAPQDRLRRDVVHWKSPFSLADGYATAAEQMCLALDRLGVPLYLESCWFDDTKGLQDWTRGKLRERFPGFLDVGVCMATPGEFRLLPTRYRIGFTMYEADRPLERYPEWRHDCDVADMLVVPSVYCRDVFRTFFRRDIVVAPLVVNETYFAPRLREARDTFTFVTYGTLSGRKSPLETIDCFQKAFPERRDVRLVLKTRFGVCGHSYRQLPVLDDPRITVISTGRAPAYADGERDWTAAEVRDWLYGADCMLFLSKGEGYGLPPREAQATGLPLIYASNTGLRDIVGGYPVPTAEVEESPIGGYWRIPDWDYAIDLMRFMVEHREEAYAGAYADAKRQPRLTGAETLAGVLADVSGYSVRRTVAPPAEDHEEFYDVVAERGGPVLDLGGNAAEGLRKRGLDVRVLTTPDRPQAGARVGSLTNLEGGWEGIRTCVCQGLLQEYRPAELRLVVDTALRVAPLMFSVPTVHAPQAPSAWSRMGERQQWEYLLNGYQKELRPYGKKQHLMGLVTARGPSQRASGLLTRDGVWRALDDGD